LFRRAEFSKFKTVVRPAYTPSSGFLVTLAVLLALAHAVLAVTATVDKSMTSDEIAHLTAGQSYNQRGDYRLQPENGNLPQRWAALPATLMGAPLPPTTTEHWRGADVWNYGHTFFYEQGLPAGTLLFLGRAMIALFSAATGLLISSGRGRSSTGRAASSRCCCSRSVRRSSRTARWRPPTW